VSVSSIAPVAAFRPVAPDADWETVRERLMDTLALAAPVTWSDHNAIEPGVTLAEATALGLADLHYRTAVRGSEAWPMEVPAWLPAEERHWHASLPVGGAAALADALAEPAPVGTGTTAQVLEPLVRACASAGDALALLSGPPWAGLFTPGQVPVTIALLRAPRVRQIAYELTDVVVAAVEAERGSADPVDVRDARATAALARSVPLWPTELAALVRRERRRRTMQAVIDRSGDVLAATTGPAATAVRAMLTGQGLSSEEADIALARAFEPVGMLPEDLEEDDGTTRVWPPHPIQALTCEPVTDLDYARRARTHPEVERAWAVAGRLAGGVGWDGAPIEITEERAGAVTLVVERAGGDSPTHEFLRDVLRVAIGSEVVRPHPTWRDTLDPLDPRRLICDEVGAAALVLCEVVLQGRLVTGVGVDRQVTVAGALARVAAFFAAGRSAGRGVADLGEAGKPDGPWPRAEQPEAGWTPGEAIRFSEVVRVIVDDPEILGVEDLSIKVGGGDFVPSSAGSVGLDPDCVPHLADEQCLRVRFSLTGDCHV
jgi:hypothetical protein